MPRATFLSTTFAIVACVTLAGCSEGSADTAEGTDIPKPIERDMSAIPKLSAAEWEAIHAAWRRSTDAETYLHPETPESFEERLKLIASEYLKYGLASRQASVAPFMCAPPPLTTPVFSSGGDPATHGQKLYYLFAADPKAYFSLNLARKGPESAPKKAVDSPVGQALVKESWTAERVATESSPRYVMHGCGIGVDQYAKDGATIFRTGEKQSLFIMFKLDPTTPQTDDGWVYGTVSPDGKTVTSAGRVENCMKCHQQAPHDRLFGLKQD